MKLFEIRDISDYQRGDERNPRSPYYEDPFPNGIPDMFWPEMPEFAVNAVSGKAPNGEAYNFTMTTSYVKGDRDMERIWEFALDKLAGDNRFAKCELVDQQDQSKGRQVVWVDFYMAERDFPINDVLRVLNDYAKNYAEEIATKRAYEYDPSDDY